MSRRVPWILFAGLALAAAGGCRGPEVPRPGAVGQPFPELELGALSDGRMASVSAYRGRSLIVNFWATWCEPCRKEMPGLERLSASAGPRGITVLGITVDSDPNLAREFVLQYRLSFPNLIDPELRLARSALDIKSFPETFLVSAEGRVLARFTGTRDWTSAEAARALKSAFGVDLAALIGRPVPVDLDQNRRSPALR